MGDTTGLVQTEDGIFWPVRDWGDDEQEPELPPLILVSSRDGRGDPVEVPNRNAAWRGLAVKAGKLGWTVVLTYALAWSADRRYKNGNLAKAAHHTHSIALRVARDDERGVGVWWRESALAELPLDAWKFKNGMYRSQGRSLGATEFKGALT